MLNSRFGKSSELQLFMFLVLVDSLLLDTTFVNTHHIGKLCSALTDNCNKIGAVGMHTLYEHLKSASSNAVEND